ncbi:MAG: helix-hairpin-helix domain-containing protein [Candidatus Omnitrophica bacterium]|nr:helix-hairpin-helix domain-containing protein [Candidatus Omnitrophota bacterium]
MLHFTKQEKQVLLLVAAVFTAGSLTHYALGRWPLFRGAVGVVESAEIYPKLDVNTASFEELVGVPYIGEYTARQIIEHRQQEGPFTSLDQVKLVRGIKEKNFAKFSAFLKVPRRP